MTAPQLPTTKPLWHKQVEEMGLQGETLFTISRLNSASKIELPQFLMLRALYQPKSRLDLEKLFDHGAVTESISSKKEALGPFEMARLYQKRSSELISDSEFRREVDSSKITVQRRVTRSQTRAEQQGSPTPKPSEELPPTMEKLSLNTPEQQSGDGSSSPAGGDEPRYLFSPTCGTPIPPSIADKVYRFIEDEQIVNFALILLLDTLVLSCPYVEGFWSPYRSPFSVRDGAVEVYQARVDGVFRRKRDLPGNMIAEVKPHSRGTNEMNVNMQESAQMAAWIAEYPQLDKQIPLTRAALGKRKGMTSKPAALPEPAEGKKPTEGKEPKRKYRRVLISQNRRDVFITIGSYDETYIDYITNVSQTEAFLEMKRYGPFEIVDAADMERLCLFLLALCIQGRILD
ncbi:hypothetical protein G3M48_001453 [Beauveria asiatica]|uniref:Uncharacterized protein n=1 Tax=Beauveria asiatica TaxID=1069075 RepID=A0AAW0RFH4_9HYPO